VAKAFDKGGAEAYKAVSREGRRALPSTTGFSLFSIVVLSLGRDVWAAVCFGLLFMCLLKR
jgi:hypothetical protein